MPAATMGAVFPDKKGKRGLEEAVQHLINIEICEGFHLQQYSLRKDKEYLKENIYTLK